MSDDKTEITKPTDFDLLNSARAPVLIVMSGRDIGRKHALIGQEIIIGRSLDAQIIIKEHNVSRRHARIAIQGDKLTIEDLGSTNGTVVNSKRVSRCDLRDGDMIGIGKTILKLSFQSDIDAAFHDEVYRSATHDELTALYNRKYFQKHLESELARVERYGREVSLLMMDIDNFKSVNDRFGHPAGDQVLRVVGRSVKSCVRNNVDVPARFGGEEFAVLFPETGLKFAKQIAEKIRKRIEESPVVYEGTTITVTVSIGVSTRNPKSTAQDLIREADDKLYQAKKKGKNRVES